MRYIEIIREAREFRDFRHAESSLKHFGNQPYDYLAPNDGFFFTYGEWGKDRGVLHLHSELNEIYSKTVLGIKTNEYLFNDLCGKVVFASKTITIQKDSVGNTFRQKGIHDIKHFQQALRELRRFGVTDDFRIKGVPPHIPKTIEAVLQMHDPTDLVITQQPIVMYHGTSMKRWQTIERKGLQPGNASGVYNDLIPNYSEHNVYLAVSAKVAEFYAKRQAQKDGVTEAVILAISVPDPTKIMADDRMVHGDDPTRTGREVSRIKDTGRTQGEFAYRGGILPKHIKMIKTLKVRPPASSSTKHEW